MCFLFRIASAMNGITLLYAPFTIPLQPLCDPCITYMHLMNATTLAIARNTTKPVEDVLFYSNDFPKICLFVA